MTGNERQHAGPRARRDTDGADDEPLRGGADEVEGIAGDQCQRARGRRVEHRDVFRIDDPGSLDAKDVLSLNRVDLDHVARSDVLQSPEEAVAVTGDADVSVGARQRRILDVPETTVERAVVSARQHCHLESQLRDSKHGEGFRSRVEERLPPGVHALGRPQGLVGCGRSKGEVLELRETLEIVARRSGLAHLECAPAHHAREAETPARELSKEQKPVTTGAHGRRPAVGKPRAV